MDANKLQKYRETKKMKYTNEIKDRRMDDELTDKHGTNKQTNKQTRLSINKHTNKQMEREEVILAEKELTIWKLRGTNRDKQIFKTAI